MLTLIKWPRFKKLIRFEPETGRCMGRQDRAGYQLGNNDGVYCRWWFRFVAVYRWKRVLVFQIGRDRHEITAGTRGDVLRLGSCNELWLKRPDGSEVVWRYRLPVIWPMIDGLVDFESFNQDVDLDLDFGRFVVDVLKSPHWPMFKGENPVSAVCPHCQALLRPNEAMVCHTCGRAWLPPGHPISPPSGVASSEPGRTTMEQKGQSPSE